MIGAADFAAFAAHLVGLPVSHFWNGYGSAIFLEFGSLTHSESRRRDGSLRNPKGEFTLMIEWSWRLEGKRRIWCGSWSVAERWQRFLPRFKNMNVVDVILAGRLPETDITFDSGLHLVSCMTAEGDPEWGLLSHRNGRTVSVRVQTGQLVRTIEPLEAR